MEAPKVTRSFDALYNMGISHHYNFWPIHSILVLQIVSKFVPKHSDGFQTHRQYTISSSSSVGFSFTCVLYIQCSSRWCWKMKLYLFYWIILSNSLRSQKYLMMRSSIIIEWWCYLYVTYCRKWTQKIVS